MKNESGTGKIRGTTGLEAYKMKKLIFLFILWASACAPEPDQVVVIEKTKSYHTQDCPKVMMADTKMMSKEEAKKLDCHPCKDCRPDETGNKP